MLTTLRKRLLGMFGFAPLELSEFQVAGNPSISALVRPWSADATHSFPSVGLTPSRLLSILQSASMGSPATQFDLFAEMLQKWPRLAAVEATRRLALTGLDWEVLPEAAHGASAARESAAQRAADYCREQLENTAGFRAALDHLASAIGYGVSAVEIVWDAGRLADLVPVPHARLTGDAKNPWQMRVRTAAAPHDGVALEPDANKWLVHAPRSLPGRLFEGGLLRASALLYLAQNLSFKDWLICSQLAGMPVRVGQFEPGTPESDKQALLKALQRIGTDSAAIFSKNVDVRLLESARGEAKTYPELQQYCNTEVTILWLGQHLTTDISKSGSRAAAEIHDRVREDLLVDDIHREGETIRRDLLRPMVLARFGDGAAVPRFRRSLIQSVDTKVLAETLSVAVRELGMRIPASWVHKALGVPAANAGEAALGTEATK